jgi:hypothetical protein
MTTMTAAKTAFDMDKMLAIIQLNSILIYLRDNTTSQIQIVKLARVKERSKYKVQNNGIYNI